MGHAAAVGLLAIFVIIFSFIKLTLSDSVGILGFIVGITALAVVVFADVLPSIRR